MAGLLCPALAAAADINEGTVRPENGLARIEAFSATEKSGFGNAVVLSPRQLVTACHVLRRAGRINVIQGSSVAGASLDDAIPAADLCLVKAPPAMSLQPMLARPVEDPLPDRMTLIAAWPDRSSYTLSHGSVVAAMTVAGVPLLLTDAPVLPGMSGGGAFDREGQLAGIVVGRWLHPDLGVVVSLAALAALPAGRKPPDMAGLAEIPAFLDERKAWPEMAMVGISRSAENAGTASAFSGGWHVSRQGRRCTATQRDPEQNDLGIILEFTAQPEAPISGSPTSGTTGGSPEGGAAYRAPSLRLAVEQQGHPVAMATSPLRLTLLPSRREFSLRPARLVQPESMAAARTWSVRWELDQAAEALKSLPGSENIIFSLGRRDTGALPAGEQALWDGIRQVCLQ